MQIQYQEINYIDKQVFQMTSYRKVALQPHNSQNMNQKQNIISEKHSPSTFINELSNQNNGQLIQMFNKLRLQQKHNQQKNYILTKQLDELNDQHMTIKLEYGRCLKQKNQLILANQQSNKQSKILSVKQRQFKKDQEFIKQLQDEKQYYKSLYFQSEDHNKSLNRKLQIFTSQQSQFTFKVKQLQIEYQMKLQQCQQHLKVVQSQNWQLNNKNMRLQTKIRKLQLQINELNQDKKQYLRRVNINKTQPIESIQQSPLAYDKSEDLNQLKYLQLHQCIQLQRFKCQTYQQHINSLQLKITKYQQRIESLKKQNFGDVQDYQQLQRKVTDFQNLLREVLLKIQSIQHNDQHFVNYCHIFKDKMNRIAKGKQVTFLNSQTKDFVVLSTRNNHEKYQDLKNELFIYQQNQNQDHFNASSQRNFKNQQFYKSKQQYKLDKKVLQQRKLNKKVLQQRRFDKKALQLNRLNRELLCERQIDKNVLYEKQLDKTVLNERQLDKKVLNERQLDKKVLQQRKQTQLKIRSSRDQTIKKANQYSNKKQNQTLSNFTIRKQEYLSNDFLTQVHPNYYRY